MRADRRLYVDKDWTKLVPEGSAEAAFLLNAPGQDIEAEHVKRLGLEVWADGRVMQGPEPVIAPEPEPEAVVSPEPLADVVRPAGAMPEPIMPPQSKRSRKKY